LDFGCNQGVLCDAETLKNTFAGFGYHVLQFRNLRAQQMQVVLSPEYLADLQQEPNKSLDKFASLVVCILAHGDKGAVTGVDGVSDELNQLQLAFNNGNCPALEGKPKVFIILACQGLNQQFLVHEDNHPQIPLRIAPPLGATNSSSPIKDFLRLSSTIEEFISWCKSRELNVITS